MSDDAASSGTITGECVADLLRGAWRAAPPPLELPGGRQAELAPELVPRRIGPLIWHRVSRGGGARETDRPSPLQEAYRRNALAAALQSREIAESAERLRAAGIPALLIKGLAAGRFYGAPALRSVGDIDFCVPAAQFEAARELLQSGPSRRSTIDLHPGRISLVDRTLEQLLERAETIELGGAKVLVPCAEDHLRLLALHAVRHAVWRPGWLCDVAAAAESAGDRFDWPRCLAGEPLHTHYLATALALAECLLGARLPAAAAAAVEPPPGWVIRSVLRRWGLGRAWGERPPLRPRLGRLLLAPRELWRELALRWPDPVLATVEQGLRFEGGSPRRQAVALLQRLRMQAAPAPPPASTGSDAGTRPGASAVIPHCPDRYLPDRSHPEGR
ncbi:MAG: nucleotidyltransferase family protein [Armatimonadota bacterium]